jgi:lipoprotein NlpI
MRFSPANSTLVWLALYGCNAWAARVGDVPELLAKARVALTTHRPDEALAQAGKAIALDDKNAEAYFLRGRAHEELRQHEKAIVDFDKAIALDQNWADAFNHRGSEQFKLGHITESIKDFDHFIKLRPRAGPGHWQRGISCYYAGKFDDGRKQFEGYQTVDDNDVENVVWRFLCMARQDGVEKARQALLKVAQDKRVPMMQIYALFGGRCQPDDVFAAARAKAPTPQQLNERLFYAHLYVGLYYEALGDTRQAKENLGRAARDHKVSHYMWDVARVHLAILDKASKGG